MGGYCCGRRYVLHGEVPPCTEPHLMQLELYGGPSGYNCSLPVKVLPSDQHRHVTVMMSQNCFGVSGYARASPADQAHTIKSHEYCCGVGWWDDVLPL
jgi:hypothetical protein